MVVSGMNEVKRWVLGYGRSAIVLEPPELVNLLRKEAEGMIRAYDRVLEAV
jgi:predicted DNA-binding transcriptional regulator YafY